MTDTVPRVLPRGRHRLSREIVRASQRTRLLEATTELISQKGYASTTIGDIVAEARIARRTFYEHFDGKLECALAAFHHVVDQLLETVVARFEPGLDQPARAELVVRGFVEFLAENPNLARVYFAEVNTLGPSGTAARLEVHRRIATTVMHLRGEVTRRQPGTPELGYLHALAIVGAVHEILEQALDQRGPARLSGVADEVTPLVVGMLEMRAPDSIVRATVR